MIPALSALNEDPKYTEVDELKGTNCLPAVAPSASEGEGGSYRGTRVRLAKVSAERK